MIKHEPLNGGLQDAFELGLFLLDFVFDVEGLRVISNWSMCFVRNLINSSFEFEILIVSLPTSAGLKIERFLSKFLLKN